MQQCSTLQLNLHVLLCCAAMLSGGAVMQLALSLLLTFSAIQQKVLKCSTPRLNLPSVVQQCGVVVRGCKWLGACHGQTAAAG